MRLSQAIVRDSFHPAERPGPRMRGALRDGRGPVTHLYSKAWRHATVPSFCTWVSAGGPRQGPFWPPLIPDGSNRIVPRRARLVHPFIHVGGGQGVWGGNLQVTKNRSEEGVRFRRGSRNVLLLAVAS